MKPLPPKPVFDATNPSVYYVRAAKFYNAAKRRGYSNAAAVGLFVAMPDMEAAFRSDVVGDGGLAYNADQWHEPRITNIFNGCGVNVKAETNIDRLVRATDWELNNTHIRARDLIVAAKTAEQAAEAATIYYEVAGAAEAAQRRGLDAEWWTVFFAKNADWAAKQG